MNKLISIFFIIIISSCSKKNDATNNPPVVILPDTLSVGWTKITSLPSESFTDIVFADNNTGYATSNNGIYKSINSGFDWTKISTDPGMVNISAANANRVCFVNNADRPFVTQDGGTSFQSTQYITPGGPPGFRDCFFSSMNTCYLASGIYMWKSTDGGVSFDTVYHFQDIVSTSTLFFLNDQTGWIVRSAGIYKTTTGGTSWTLLKPLTNGYGAVEFLDQNNGYFSDNGIILKSTDGGTTIQSIFDIPNYGFSTPAFTDIDFINSNEGYISSGNRVYKTINAGATWTAVARLGNETIIEIYFTDANHGWACTTDGTVLKFVQ